MARRKNVKRIDPRYFLHETVNRGEEELEERSLVKRNPDAAKRGRRPAGYDPASAGLGSSVRGAAEEAVAAQIRDLEGRAKELEAYLDDDRFDASAEYRDMHAKIAQLTKQLTTLQGRRGIKPRNPNIAQYDENIEEAEEE